MRRATSRATSRTTPDKNSSTYNKDLKNQLRNIIGAAAANETAEAKREQKAL